MMPFPTDELARRRRKKQVEYEIAFYEKRIEQMREKSVEARHDMMRLDKPGEDMGNNQEYVDVANEYQYWQTRVEYDEYQLERLQRELESL